MDSLFREDRKLKIVFKGIAMLRLLSLDLLFTSVLSITLLESSMIIVPSYKTKCTDGYID